MGGGGHVGLPLSLAFCRVGQRVAILDIAQDTLDLIGSGVMPFREEGAEELLRELLPTGRLVLSADPSVLRDAENVVIVIGTPIDEFLNPSRSPFDRIVDQLAASIRPGALVVLRSTVYPGTTAYVADALENRGCQVDIAFCPERIAEGHALRELTTLPQIVGADHERAGERAAALFSLLGVTTVPTTTKEAELAKLFTNSWRYVKFAAANQFLMIAHDAGVDYNKVLHAVRHDYPRALDLPGPGFSAGPCLLKDTMQLAAFTSDHFPLGQAAMQVNEGLPAYLVAAMERRYGSLRDRTIGILGMAFKADSDDARASLSYKLRKLLLWSGAKVACTDPHVRDDRLVPLEEVMRDSDILVLGAPHQEYSRLKVGGRDIVDVWGVFGEGIQL